MIWVTVRGGRMYEINKSQKCTCGERGQLCQGVKSFFIPVDSQVMNVSSEVIKIRRVNNKFKIQSVNIMTFLLNFQHYFRSPILVKNIGVYNN